MRESYHLFHSFLKIVVECVEDNECKGNNVDRCYKGFCSCGDRGKGCEGMTPRCEHGICCKYFLKNVVLNYYNIPLKLVIKST